MRRPRLTEVGDNHPETRQPPARTQRLLPPAGSARLALPCPSLAADLAAAADAAAVRWKQHKELSTWRLVKEKNLSC